MKQYFTILKTIALKARWKCMVLYAPGTPDPLTVMIHIVELSILCQIFPKGRHHWHVEGREVGEDGRGEDGRGGEGRRTISIGLQ